MKKLSKKYFKESDFGDDQIIDIFNNCKMTLKLLKRVRELR